MAKKSKSTKPLTWTEFRKAAVDNGFVIHKTPGVFGRKEACYPHYRILYAGRYEPLPCGDFIQAMPTISIKSHASIVSDIDLTPMEIPNTTRKKELIDCYDYKSCNKAFLKLKRLLDRLVKKVKPSFNVIPY